MYDEGIPEFIQSDFQRLNQVFKNLLSNAIKFTREGGITITLKRPSPEIDLFSSGLNPDQTLAIEISDTGIGIPGNVQNAIFEAFQQADGTTSRTYGGTGLGLSISRELTRLLGGEIQLKSVEGEGAAFTVYIPEQLKKSETAHKNKRAKERSILSDLQIPQESKILNGKRVLVVDDDMRNLFAISNILKKINMIVFKAKDGLMALQTLEKESGIDMILMDIMMPVMDGYETIRRIRTMKQFKEIPVIALSAKAMPEDLEKCLSAGANDFLPKPVKVNLLLQKMEKLITPE
ncbi:MAG: response regulator [bacterium]|nr:response regulator [bacterium]